MNETNRIEGKTCLVTGATSGIGKAAAEALTQAGADVVLGGRSEERLSRTAEEIERSTGRRPQLFLCDFDSLTDVRRSAEDWLATDRPLHVLLNNAGVFLRRQDTTAEAHERMFGVNHLAPFLLTRLLLPRLQDSGGGRIVFVASDAHKYSGAPDFASLNRPQRFSAFRAYGHSKGCNIMFSERLAQQLQGSSVTVNAMHPGAVLTGLGGLGELGKPLRRLLSLFFRSPQQGADTAVWLATDPRFAADSGGYYKNRAANRAKAWVRDSEQQQKLWQLSEGWVGL